MAGTPKSKGGNSPPPSCAWCRWCWTSCLWIWPRLGRRYGQWQYRLLAEAWKAVLPLTFEYVNSEVNPSLANIVSPSEVVVVSTFHVELDGGGGDMHITVPYSMIEPIREVLDSGLQSDSEDRKSGVWEDAG